MKNKKSFNKYFESEDLKAPELYSLNVIQAIIRSILEPIAAHNAPGIIFANLNDIEGVTGPIRRLEYAKNVTLKTFSDFEFSKFDVEKTGFIILTTNRYNCVFLFREVEKNKYQIYFKVNSKLVTGVYETLKNMFLINYDEEFLRYRPERRENNLMNEALTNLLTYFNDSTKEQECSEKIHQDDGAESSIRNEIYDQIKQTAHEIKNQLSILDIYSQIFEKKTNDPETTAPIRKSIETIKTQIEQFKNMDMIELQELDIKSIIKESIRQYGALLKEKSNKLILIDEMPGYDAHAFVDKEKFLTIVNNIIKNAHDATKNDNITIRIIQENEKIKIQFINHGQVIQADEQDKIFNQGYTTKKDGWGVGLSVCKKYIESQSGTLELEKSDKQETIFTLAIPAAKTR